MAAREPGDDKMPYAQLKWPAPFMIAAFVAVSAVATIPHVRPVDLVLDSGTGILASLGAAIAGTHLIVGQLRSRGRLAWKLTLAALLFLALGEFCEPFAEAAEQQLHIDNIDDLLLLATAPVILRLFANLEPVQIVPRHWMVVGVALQILATGLDFLDEAHAVFLGSADLATCADFTQLLSVSSYVLALSCAALHGRRPPEASILTETKRRAFSHSRLSPQARIAGRGLSVAESPAAFIHRLCNEARQPARDIGGAALNAALILSWPFIASLRAHMAVGLHGARVQWLTGKTKPEQFIEQLGLALRHRIPPIYYYVYEFYRPGRRLRAGDYLMPRETREIAYRLLDPRPTRPQAPTPLADKVEFARHCQRHGLRHVPVVMLFESGRCLTEHGFANRLPEADLFVKPAFGNGGGAAERWRSLGAFRFRNTRGDRLDAGALLAHVARLSLSAPYLIQTAVSNHQEISRLSAGALSTVRLLSCRNERGDFEVTDAAFRMSVDPRSPVDGFDAGGVAAAVDVRTGLLGFATGFGHAANTEWHTMHPFSGAQIAGCQLPLWRETIALAARAHRVFNDYAIIGWDIAILEDGPCLIAGDRDPDVDLLQRTADAPIGSGRFGELLAYNLERETLAGRHVKGPPGP
jgi:hypothetical protein